VGQLLDTAHRSARDDYDISCREVEALVEAARSVPGTVGARLTGAGWGGCIVALVQEAAASEFGEAVPNEYRDRTGLSCSVFACRAGGAAGYLATL
jgi:galactokinase